MKLSTSSLLLLASWVSATAIDPQHPLLHKPSTIPTLLELHKALVEHESISGNERAVTDYLVSYLKAQNFTVEKQLVEPKNAAHDARHNVLAYIGKQRQTRALITSHTDTVPPFWPYQRVGDEIWGRGTVDAKGSVATQIKAVEALRAVGQLGEGDLALLFVVGEEVDGIGMETANELGLTWETVIFGEPTELKLAEGHKGIMSLNVTARGKAAHSGYPELGRSANEMMVKALGRLLEVELPWSEKFGNTTLNIGTMEGGVAANVIPEYANARVTLRLADGSPAGVEKILLDAINAVGAEFDVVVRQGYGPVHIDSDVEGFDTIVVNYGTDIPNLKGDHKRYLYGAGSILMAHSDHEHLKVSDLEEAVEGYKKLIAHALR